MTTGKARSGQAAPGNGERAAVAGFLSRTRVGSGKRPAAARFRFHRQCAILTAPAWNCCLRCMEEAMKRNGDLKLAALSPQLAVILEMTRVDRLFEIFDNCNDAVESFHRFSPSPCNP